MGAVVLIGYIAWLAWQNLGPHRPEIDPARRQLADKVIVTVVEDLTAGRGPLRQAALMQLENDPTGYVTDRLRAEIERRGILDLRDRTVGEKLADLLGLRRAGHGDMDAAVSRGRARGSPAVLFGTVHALGTGGFGRAGTARGADIDLEITLADTATGQVLFTRRYTRDTTPLATIITDLQATARGVPWYQRLVAWALIVLLLPVFTIGFVRAMVRRGSNRANAFVLGIYTLAGALLAFLLAGAAFDGWLAVVVFIAAVAAAFLYNVRIMTFALRLEES
ncbi:MAG: hypothetical protein JJU36_04705 [Phycisphaeraceae bacterium]|nr:hypothetical protein [Phycisphaeraceae bacterium]